MNHSFLQTLFGLKKGDTQSIIVFLRSKRHKTAPQETKYGMRGHKTETGKPAEQVLRGILSSSALNVNR